MKKLKYILIILVLFIFLWFFARMVNSKEIDDVSPGIFCEKEYLMKSDVLWVIPKFENKSIAENKSWCEYVLSLNKTLGLHGVLHEYEEFGEIRNQDYLDEGMDMFEECFGFKPVMFKPPQLKIIKENKNLVQKNSLMFKGKWNQGVHKVYHCNDTGMISNEFIDLF